MPTWQYGQYGHMADDDEGSDGLDFAIVAWREDGEWQAEVLPAWNAESLDSLVTAMRAHPGESGCIALLSYAEDFFLVVRVLGEAVRLVLSDSTAGADWPLAAEALEALEIDAPSAEEIDEIGDEPDPVGDMKLLADLGMDPDEFDVLVSDLDIYPDEILSVVAARLGFGDQFDDALDSG